MLTVSHPQPAMLAGTNLHCLVNRDTRALVACPELLVRKLVDSGIEPATLRSTGRNLNHTTTCPQVYICRYISDTVLGCKLSTWFVTTACHSFRPQRWIFQTFSFSFEFLFSIPIDCWLTFALSVKFPTTWRHVLSVEQHGTSIGSNINLNEPITEQIFDNLRLISTFWASCRLDGMENINYFVLREYRWKTLQQQDNSWKTCL